MKKIANDHASMSSIRTALVAVAFVLGASGICLAGPKPAPKPVPPPFQAGYTAGAVQNGGTISGKVLYKGKPIRPKKVTVTQDNNVCGNMKDIYPAKIDDGGVVDAVVSLDGISNGKAFSFPPAILDQKGCMFVPPVVLMAPGNLKVENSDSVAHNVHVYAKNNRSFNQVMPPGSAPLEIPLHRPDTAMVRCDVHTWMEGYIVVAANPYYALTGPGGSFTLTDVPPGTYHVKVWQSNLGTKETTVTVQAGKTATADFTYTK